MSRISRSIVELSAIMPQDIFIGTSLILRHGDRFLYGIRPVRQEGHHPVLELTGIGGGLEKTDRSYTEGVLREVHEEIGGQVTLMAAEETIVIRGPDKIDWVQIAGAEMPVAVVFRHYRTPPHEPWHPDHQGLSCLIVFLAELDGLPKPGLELPHLIWLSAEQVVDTARHDVHLGSLLTGGAQLVEGPGGPPPLDGLARLTDSQEALILALGEEALEFYLG